MAVEEQEYFSVTAGNGLSPVTRAQKGPVKKAKQQSQKSGSRATSFLQGITVGTVLLIPVGVWCWVRPGGTEFAPAVTEEAAPTSKTAGKAGKRVAAGAPKRKPVKANTAVALPPARIDSGRPSVRMESDPPPPIAASTPAAIPTSRLVAKPPADDTMQEFDDPQKPKKSVWRTLSSPFRGKSKPSDVQPVQNN